MERVDNGKRYKTWGKIRKRGTNWGMFYKLAKEVPTERRGIDREKGNREQTCRRVLSLCVYILVRAAYVRCYGTKCPL